MYSDSAELIRVNFVREKENAYQRIYKRSPIISSMSLGWDNLGIAYDWYPVEKVPKIISQQHSIGIFTDVPSPTIIERYINGSFKREEVVTGSCVIIPANTSQYAYPYKEISITQQQQQSTVFWRRYGCDRW